MNKVLRNNMINGVASDYLSIDDRAIHYGDGLFETLLCRDNKVYYWAQHYSRLQRSAQRLKIACPAESLLLDDIARLFEENTQTTGSARVIKIIITRGAGERGYKFLQQANSNRLLTLSKLETEHSSLLAKKLLAGKLFLCEQQVSINKNLAGLKHLNRLENVLARNEWQDGYIDGLMCNANQHVIEGTMSNLFAVKDGQLFSPDLAVSGVNGIMRDVIMAAAEKNNIEVIVKDLNMDALFAMDEVFISNSLIGVKSVTGLADVTYNKPQVCNIILQELLNSMEDHAQVI